MTSSTKTPLSLRDSQLVSTGDNRLQTVCTPLETSNNAVHAGLSLHQRLFLTVSVLPQKVQSMLSSHHKTWLAVIAGTWVAMVVFSHGLGAISRTLALLLRNAKHTFLDQDQSLSAPRHAMMDLPKSSTSVLLHPLLNHQVLLPFNLIFMLTAQLRLASMFTKISSRTRVVSTTIPLGLRLVDTPSRSLDGVKKTALTTGSAQTHGVLHGAWTVSSILSGANVALIQLLMLANLSFEKFQKFLSY